MPVKSFELLDVGTLFVYRRKGSKSIRLTVNSDGKIRVTIPMWLPYRAGLQFATQKRQWLAAQIPAKLEDGQLIGKSHRLALASVAGQTEIRTKLTSDTAMVLFPQGADKQQVQVAAQKVAKRALLAQAERFLPMRINDLALYNDLKYGQLNIRHLKSRWGSCSSKHDITLNYYLLQLPWELIDYVIVHELAHTVHLNHSAAFWQTVESMEPNYKNLRRRLRGYQPSVLQPQAR